MKRQEMLKRQISALEMKEGLFKKQDL